MKKLFKVGDPVYHSRLGFGVVLEQWGSWIDIDERGKELTVNGEAIFDVKFDGSGIRAVSGDSLSLIVGS